MSYIKKNGPNVLPIVISVVALMSIAAWQYYQFSAFKDQHGALDLQGGSLHLWVAIGASIAACACAFVGMFRRLNKAEEFHINA